MNQDTLMGNLKQLSAEVKKRWAKLTDDDITAAQGEMEKLSGKIQERYGIARDEAAKQVEEFAKQIRNNKTNK